MLKRIRKIIAPALIILLGISPLALFARAESAPASFPEISSPAAVLMEFSRGEILFSQNGSERMPPASLTKIMTLFLAFEAREEGRVSWDDKVVISEKAWKTGGSQMFLNAGDSVAFRDLVTGIAVVSANDACVALAEHLSGLEASFVQEMNNKARELNLKNTRFENASGLPHPDHYSTAEDIALLSHSLINKYPEVLDLYSQEGFTFNGISQMNRNPLLGRFPGADGLKTGHTTDAGYCLAGTAEQNGMRFISVIFNASSEGIRQKDSEALLNFAFRNYCLETVFTAGEIVATTAVSKGEEKEIQLEVGNDTEVVIPYDRKDDLEIRMDVPEIVTSPVSKGTPLGKVEIILDGTVLKEEPLLASDDVARAGHLTLFWRSLSGFVSSLWTQLIEKIQNVLPW
ncbi:MAG TPA: D-alanyl-D-alanine carboxypeptidase [Firmicutes bacterium]|jgi:D-alanyl-D-alanine carboxypeptidase (penicillin-binding protein 5/6)|nr:D-alanyl-D-alanine carboxypeptidase [Bacillota bacterium]